MGETQKVDFRELVEPRMLSILTLGITLAVLQQWCGINVIFYYAADLFRAAGSTVGDALLNIVIIGTVNLLATVVAVFSVDRLGRRSLLVAGFAGLTVTHTALAMSFWAGWTGGAVLAITLAAIGCYALTLAPVTWVVLSEIFPNRIRGGAMSVSVFALWTACFLLTFTFPLLNAQAGNGRHLRHLRDHLCVWALLHPRPACRNEGEDARGDREGTRGVGRADGGRWLKGLRRSRRFG